MNIKPEVCIFLVNIFFIKIIFRDRLRANIQKTTQEVRT